MMEKSGGPKLYALVVRNIWDIADVVMWANSDNVIRIRKEIPDRRHFFRADLLPGSK